jgi:hypothetical protein
MQLQPTSIRGRTGRQVWRNHALRQRRRAPWPFVGKRRAVGAEHLFDWVRESAGDFTYPRPVNSGRFVVSLAHISTVPSKKGTNGIWPLFRPLSTVRSKMQSRQSFEGSSTEKSKTMEFLSSACKQSLTYLLHTPIPGRQSGALRYPWVRA